MLRVVRLLRRSITHGVVPFPEKSLVARQISWAVAQGSDPRSSTHHETCDLYHLREYLGNENYACPNH
jgi:hypothetical protein